MKWLVCKYGRYKAQVFKVGDVVELDAETAKFVNEDEPGTLAPCVEPAPEARQVEQPAEDRMVRGGSKRAAENGTPKKHGTEFAATKSGKKY